MNSGLFYINGKLRLIFSKDYAQYQATIAQQRLYAIRADSYILSFSSLPFFSYWLDRFLISFVSKIIFRFFNKHQHWADAATIPVLRKAQSLAEMGNSPIIEV